MNLFQFPEQRIFFCLQISALASQPKCHFLQKVSKVWVSVLSLLPPTVSYMLPLITLITLLWKYLFISMIFLLDCKFPESGDELFLHIILSLVPKQFLVHSGYSMNMFWMTGLEWWHCEWERKDGFKKVEKEYTLGNTGLGGFLRRKDKLACKVTDAPHECLLNG